MNVIEKKKKISNGASVMTEQGMKSSFEPSWRLIKPNSLQILSIILMNLNEKFEMWLRLGLNMAKNLRLNLHGG